MRKLKTERLTKEQLESPEFVFVKLMNALGVYDKKKGGQDD